MCSLSNLYVLGQIMTWLRHAESLSSALPEAMLVVNEYVVPLQMLHDVRMDNVFYILLMTLVKETPL